MASYHDVLYARHQRIVLWGIVIDDAIVNAELGAFGEDLPPTVELFNHPTNHQIPVATVALDRLSGIAGEGLLSDLKLPILKD